MAAGLGSILPIVSSTIPLNNVTGAIGGGSEMMQPQTPDVAISEAKQRVQDLAGGKTGSFDVNIGGGYSNLVFVCAIGLIILMIVKKKW